LNEDDNSSLDEDPIDLDQFSSSSEDPDADIKGQLLYLYNPKP